MSDQFAREILRRNVAQICQTIGWNGINSTPLDILTHVLEKYIRTLGTHANRYAEQFNRSEPNLHDLGLVFRDLNVELPELADYVRSVPSVPPPVSVEQFPQYKESNLNFLKPGSHEVVTRPMHVHEHLPPMYAEKERETPAVASTVEVQQNGMDTAGSSTTATCTSPEISVTDSPEKPKDVFKRPTDPVSLPTSKKPRIRLDEDERTREISSVMMTMSGFLSPAREGKLPEARPPTIMSEKHTDKHKTNTHHSSAVAILDKSEKKSKKNKLLNGKITKSKRKDKSHKGEGSKSKDGSKSNKNPSLNPLKSKDSHLTHNQLGKTGPKASPSPAETAMPPPPAPSVPEATRTVIKQELIEPLPGSKPPITKEDTIPVPRKIPISKSPLVSNIISVHKSQSTVIPDTDVMKETIKEEEKLASQPDRSKLNIFKRISNKNKEDRNVQDNVSEKSDSLISKKQNSVHDILTGNKSNDNIRAKPEETFVNNNDTSAVDLSKEMDLRAHEVINIDDDSLDMTPVPDLQSKTLQLDFRPSPSSFIHSQNKSLQLPNSKDIASVSPKIKKEKKHKDKKDKAAKLEAKLLKKQQQQLALEMAQAEKQAMNKPAKSSRPKNETKMSQITTSYPFFPAIPSGRNLMPGPGLTPNSSSIPGNDFLTGLTNNPALRGLPSTNLLTNPFTLGASGPGLIPSPSYLTSSLSAGITNPLMHMGNYPQSSRSSPMEIPPILRRPSLEVIPVDNDEERGIHQSQTACDIDRQNTHKSPTIPNILQKHKTKSYKDYKSSIFKMPPVQPDITIELNPPKSEPIRHEPLKDSPQPIRSPTPEFIKEVIPEPQNEPNFPEILQDKEITGTEKKKDKSHKKEKKDKDGIKIKKKKDKKDKNRDKSDKKREKEVRQEIKDKIKKEKKVKKKEKAVDGLVPKLTLKLASSNSNSPMPESSSDVFKLNIKPVVKKEDESSPVQEDSGSREHSRSPELAQISALVTRPPKQKHSKHNPVSETEVMPSSPPSTSSPPRKNRPPSTQSKYKRILFKPMSKKGHFDDEIASISEEPPETPVTSATPVEKPSGPLPTPYYVDGHGNKVWVCPACGRPDNGSPMIGCDGCDGWYHWVCVGITEEPGATEDWFCKSCLAKRTAMVLAGVTTGKKRGRKPKGAKVRDCQ